MTICAYLDGIAEKYPDRPAIVFAGKRWTYAGYAEAVDRFANAFAAAGVEYGDRIAVFNTNCPEHLFTPFAAARLGAAYSPMNCRLKGDELAHHEVATFRKVEDRWYFVDGKMAKHETFVRQAPKVGRNDPCPCGSGKKYKKCCG